MNQSFTDDSSSALGLGHGATSHSTELERLRVRRASDKAQYLDEIGLRPDPKDLQEYLEAGLSAEDAREAAINKVLSQRPPNSSDGTIERRMQKYIEAGYTTVEAMNLAEDEIDIEREARVDDYLGDSIENLMRSPVEPHGSSSRGKNYKTVRRPDATDIESRLRREMAA